jgi:arginase
MYTRRGFLKASHAAPAFSAQPGRIETVLGPIFARDQGETMSEYLDRTERSYHVLEVPLRTGSLYPGSENDAQAYRDVQLLPRQQPGHIPLLIGCDCSVVVGTTQALMSASRENVHVLHVDGDFDDAAPEPERCQSAASCGLWLLTHRSPFWAGPPLRPSQVTVIGWSNPSRSEQTGVRSMSLVDVRRSGAGEVALQAPAAIPDSAPVLLHFDVDVLHKLGHASRLLPAQGGTKLLRRCPAAGRAPETSPDPGHRNQRVCLLA